MNLEQFKREIEFEMYEDIEMLHLIKYLSQNRYECVIFESKIISLIERMIRIYS